jgi:hypothetical protein
MSPDDDLFDILKAIKEQSVAIARMQAQLEDLINSVDHHLGMMYKIIFAALVIVGGVVGIKVAF